MQLAWCTKSIACPQVLHTSQQLVTVVVAGRLGVAGWLGAIVGAVVIVVNVDITALVGAKCPMSNFLDLLFFFWYLLVFILLLLVGGCFLTKV